MRCVTPEQRRGIRLAVNTGPATGKMPTIVHIMGHEVGSLE
jgi:hypothetical protein